jgi:hypothetical protein
MSNIANTAAGSSNRSVLKSGFKILAGAALVTVGLLSASANAQPSAMPDVFAPKANTVWAPQTNTVRENLRIRSQQYPVYPSAIGDHRPSSSH